MKPVFCFIKPDITPKFIFIEESRWKEILYKKINIFGNYSDQWEKMTKKQQQKYVDLGKKIKDDNQLDEYLRPIKQKIYDKSKTKTEIRKLSNIIKKKKISKKK